MLKLIKKARQDVESLMRRGKIPRGRHPSIIHVTNTLHAKHIRDGKVIDERIVKNKKVTDDFVDFIVDNLVSDSTEFGDFKYHDSGTDNTAENQTDSALGTPCGEARTVGTQEEGSQTYEYKSVATHTYAGSFTIVEHGLFSQSTGGTLMDRTVFTGIGVTSGDKIEFTFTIQFSAET